MQAELTTSNRLLPPRWGDIALTDRVDQVAEWFASLVRRDFHVSEEDLLLARKLGRGARPLSLLGLQERLLFRGAVGLVESSSNSTSDRSFEAYQTFQQAPLQASDARYVFKTDIAAYYQYIDHERLVDEVISQTGGDLAISVAVDLLRQVSGRAYGLPQLSRPSDILAEIYIEPMRRALIRAGFEVFRFADDFRVVCRRYDEALAAWEAADTAARDLGLVLNEGKTSILKMERYAESLAAVRDQELQLFADLNVEELDEPDYADGPEIQQIDTLIDEQDFEEGEVVESAQQPELEVTVGAAQVEAAGKVLDRWVAGDEDDTVQRQESAHVTAALLRRALRVFTSAVDPTALPTVAGMFIYEPSLTPTIATYMVRCGEVYRSGVREALDDASKSRALNAWQATWLAYVAGSLPRRKGGGDLAHVRWLKEQYQSASPALAAEAVLALARRRLVPVQDVNAVIGRLTPVQRPTGVIALAALGEERMARDMASSELDRIRVQWAVENL